VRILPLATYHSCSLYFHPGREDFIGPFRTLSIPKATTETLRLGISPARIQSGNIKATRLAIYEEKNEKLVLI
jgi:hypothetical protein